MNRKIYSLFIDIFVAFILGCIINIVACNTIEMYYLIPFIVVFIGIILVNMLTTNKLFAYIFAGIAFATENFWLNPFNFRLSPVFPKYELQGAISVFICFMLCSACIHFVMAWLRTLKCKKELDRDVLG